MKVYTLTTARGGIAKNQFVMKDDKGKLTFQSYNSVIADYDGGEGVLYIHRDYKASSTTMRYLLAFIRQYLGVSISSVKELEKEHLNNGTIIKKEVA